MLVANQPRKLDAIRARHHEVDDGEVERPRGEHGERAVRIRHRLHLESFAAQADRHDPSVVRFVVDHQDARLHVIFSSLGKRSGVADGARSLPTPPHTASSVPASVEVPKAWPSCGFRDLRRNGPVPVGAVSFQLWSAPIHTCTIAGWLAAALPCSGTGTGTGTFTGRVRRTAPTLD